METLISLLTAKKNQVKGNNNGSELSKLTFFENLLIENPNLTDEEACQKIYGLKNKTNTYKSLKYRLEEKIMDEVFSGASAEFNLKSRVNAKLVVSKFYTIALVLLKSGQRKSSVNLLEKGLKIAIKNSYTDFILILLKPLISHFSFVDPNEKKMKEYIKLNEYYAEIYTAEDFVKLCNAHISHMYVMNKGAFNQAQLKDIELKVKRMNEIKDKHQSNTIYTHTYDLTFFYYSLINQHQKCLEIAKESLEINLSASNNDIFGIYQSKRNLAVSHFQLGQYDEANKWFTDILTMAAPGTRNWIFSAGLYFLSLIGCRDYQNLFKLTMSVLHNKNLTKFPIYEEQWKIREAYLHFLIRLGKMNLTSEENSKMKPFILSKFLNSLPFYSKDKTGQNITIIIIQILFLILDRKYNQVIDRIDALTQYTYRYIRKDESFRSNCFIKMLLLAIKADFHPVRTQTYTAELHKKLLNSHLVTDEKSTQVEIIPYDFLWELLVEILYKNK
ncbi:MAG: tetratricopeptide repeat protein [Saprospiraceae bacterium]|nr:tetratricopeptide repeat protein [Saprospiraceae bacterium]